MNKAIIEINNATIQKNNYTLLNNINLVIHNNENIAIIGPNGSGKTSLLKLISREYYPVFSRKTKIEIFGQSVWDLFKLRSKIGIVSDSIQKFNNTSCTGFETVLSGFFSSIGIYSTHKVTKQMMKKANEIINFLEISYLKNKKLCLMSSGELNRFLVARALVNEPDVLILDEPTSNLDIKAMNIFLSYIQKIANHGKTIIMVTHHIHDIIPGIERVIMLKKGEIYRDGKKEELLTSEILSDLFDYKLNVFKKDKYYSYY